MEHPAPEGISEQGLRAILESDWGLPAPSVGYVPKGAGSYHWVASSRAGRHFVTVDDLDAKPWIARARDDTFSGLRRAYAAVRHLHDRHRFDMAVPAVASGLGEVLLRLDDRYAMSVFPFVDGAPGSWGSPIDRVAAQELLAGLAALHAVPPSDVRLPARPYDLPERGVLDALPARLAGPWTAGPFSGPARTALLAALSDLEGWLDELDNLAARLEASGLDVVVTHGEPHPGNLIATPAGLRLVDWDTVALAPPERDLWMLGAATPALLGRYEEITGRRRSEAALRFYSLAWTLSDIAYLTDLVRDPPPSPSTSRRHFEGLLRFLSGEQSTPYAAPDAVREG